MVDRTTLQRDPVKRSPVLEPDAKIRVPKSAPFRSERSLPTQPKLTRFKVQRAFPIQSPFRPTFEPAQGAVILPNVPRHAPDPKEIPKSAR